MAEAYPLQWPIGRARWSGRRTTSAFKMDANSMQKHLFDELARMQATGVVVSTNQAGFAKDNRTMDPGVAVYFKRKGQELCIACDKYIKVADNLHAVGMAVEAFRMLERHGTGEMVDAAFSGFKALPESVIITPDTSRAWHEVLQVSSTADWEVVKAAYNRLLHKTHPDKGGSDYAFQELQRAYKQAKELYAERH